MTAPREQLDQLVADLAEQHKALLDAQQRLGEVSATVTSPRNVLTVTVGAAGQLQEIRFNNRDYRTMGPEDLGDLVLTTIQEARAAVAEQVHDTMQPLAGDNTALDDMLAGSFDWQRVFPPGMFEQLGRLNDSDAGRA